MSPKRRAFLRVLGYLYLALVGVSAIAACTYLAFQFAGLDVAATICVSLCLLFVLVVVEPTNH